jgi:hypothetical protein
LPVAGIEQGKLSKETTPTIIARGIDRRFYSNRAFVCFVFLEKAGIIFVSDKNGALVIDGLGEIFTIFPLSLSFLHSILSLPAQLPFSLSGINMHNGFSFVRTLNALFSIKQISLSLVSVPGGSAMGILKCGDILSKIDGHDVYCKPGSEMHLPVHTGPIGQERLICR